MTTDILAVAVALPDAELLSRIDILASRERQSSAELVAHLAALELRPSLYAAQGYGSLFAYCTRALRLSEDAADNRLRAARLCRRFPMVLDQLASGSLTLSSVRMLAPHLTAENHEAVLARASNRRREAIEALVAELAPRADVVASVRKLPAPTHHDLPSGAPSVEADTMNTMAVSSLSLLGDAPVLTPSLPPTAVATRAPCATSQVAGRLAHRPIVEPLAPKRYRVQFTIGQEAYDQLRRLQDLLRREVPNGDPGQIFVRALGLLHDRVERAKLGGRRRTRSKGPIRRAADKAPRPDFHERPAAERSEAPAARTTASRHIPNQVKRAVWWRDRGQCAFVSPAGQRCTERRFLELHHIQPHALGGPATARNISLRCRTHNQYEAELVFGADVAERRHAHETSRILEPRSGGDTSRSAGPT